MTLCNMSIEAGARAGMVAVDEKTIEYVKGRPLAPKGAMWDKAVAYWRTLVSDPGAKFDKVVTLDAADDPAAGDLGHQSADGDDRRRQGARPGARRRTRCSANGSSAR